VYLNISVCLSVCLSVYLSHRPKVVSLGSDVLVVHLSLLGLPDCLSVCLPAQSTDCLSACVRV
jgi:hypothetical protein